MRKSLEIRDERTIAKFDAIKAELKLSAPKIIDRALNCLILSIEEGYALELSIQEYITKVMVRE